MANVSTSPTPPASQPAERPELFKDVRSGVAIVLLVVGLIALGGAIYFARNAQELGSTEDAPAADWGAGFKTKRVMPIFIWSAFLAVGGLAASFLVNQTGKAHDEAGAKQFQWMLAMIQFVLAGAMIAVPIYMISARSSFSLALGPPFLWGAGLAVLFLIGGILVSTQNPTEHVRLRLTVMAIGGVAGLLTILLGFALPVFSYSETLKGGLEEWRKNWPAIVLPSLAAIGGLTLMFLSLQLGRDLERQSQGIRRLIYGYNAVLTGLLLIAVLALPNVLAYAEPFTQFFGRAFDWTATDLNTISPPFRSLIANLQEPVKVYVLMPRRNPVAQDAITLLENLRSLNPGKFSWVHLSPDNAENINRINGMIEKYSFQDPDGLLVLVGAESETSQPDFAFIKSRDLVETERLRGGPQSDPSYSFLGEGQLYNTIASLAEGKMVIYFTQGHGEISPEGPAPFMQKTKRRTGGLTQLKTRIEGMKGTVKPLKLDQTTRRIPDVASVVVIARPTQPFGKHENDVLRDYLKRSRETRTVKDKAGADKEEETVTSGRLMVLVEPILETTGGKTDLVPTGLEGLLAEYSVQLGPPILSLDLRLANGVLLTAGVLAITPGDSANPVAKAFHPSAQRRTNFLFMDCRVVEPLNTKGGKATVDKLVESRPDLSVVANSSTITKNPGKVVDALRADEEEKAKLPQPRTLAVAVSDSSGPPGLPRDAAHGGLHQDSPRMVVFGSSSWISDDFVGRGGEGIDLFMSCVSWLREKSTIGKPREGKKRPIYTLNIPKVDAGRVTYLPLGLLLLGVVGLGTGVWVVRRR